MVAPIAGGLGVVAGGLAGGLECLLPLRVGRIAGVRQRVGQVVGRAELAVLAGGAELLEQDQGVGTSDVLIDGFEHLRRPLDPAEDVAAVAGRVEADAGGLEGPGEVAAGLQGVGDTSPGLRSRSPARWAHPRKRAVGLQGLVVLLGFHGQVAQEDPHPLASARVLFPLVALAVILAGLGVLLLLAEDLAVPLLPGDSLPDGHGGQVLGVHHAGQCGLGAGQVVAVRRDVGQQAKGLDGLAVAQRAGVGGGLGVPASQVALAHLAAVPGQPGVHHRGGGLAVLDLRQELIEHLNGVLAFLAGLPDRVGLGNGAAGDDLGVVGEIADQPVGQVGDLLLLTLLVANGHGDVDGVELLPRRGRLVGQDLLDEGQRLGVQVVLVDGGVGLHELRVDALRRRWGRGGGGRKAASIAARATPARQAYLTSFRVPCICHQLPSSGGYPRASVVARVFAGRPGGPIRRLPRFLDGPGTNHPRRRFAKPQAAPITSSSSAAAPVRSVPPAFSRFPRWPRWGRTRRGRSRSSPAACRRR